jgi:hypothetical protein
MDASLSIPQEALIIGPPVVGEKHSEVDCERSPSPSPTLRAESSHSRVYGEEVDG